MAMIKCPECRNMVSDTNKTCPYCGANTDAKVRCPRCQSNDVQLDVLMKGPFFDALMEALFGWFFSGVLGGAKKTHIRGCCNRCGHRFKIKQ